MGRRESSVVALRILLVPRKRSGAPATASRPALRQSGGVSPAASVWRRRPSGHDVALGSDHTLDDVDLAALGPRHVLEPRDHSSGSNIHLWFVIRYAIGSCGARPKRLFA
jgi:hypothetical protein